MMCRDIHLTQAWQFVKRFHSQCMWVTHSGGHHHLHVCTYYPLALHVLNRFRKQAYVPSFDLIDALNHHTMVIAALSCSYLTCQEEALCTRSTDTVYFHPLFYGYLLWCLSIDILLVLQGICVFQFSRA